MRKICGAIERVYVPAEFRCGFAPRAFFGGNGVLRKVFMDSFDDGALGALVRLRDEIDLLPLVTDFHRLRQLFDKNLACFPGDLDRSFQIVLGHGKESSARVTKRRSLVDTTSVGKQRS